MVANKVSMVLGRATMIVAYEGPLSTGLSSNPYQVPIRLDRRTIKTVLGRSPGDTRATMIVAL